MKTAVILLAVLSGACVSFATPLPGTLVSSRVIERGPACKLIETTIQTTNELGAPVQKTGRYTIIGNGLHRKDADGNWVESAPVVQSYSSGIVCTGAAYRVLLSSNLYSVSGAAVDLETSAHRRMVSQPLGIAFYDPASGRSVWLAQVQDSAAHVVSSNRVLYADAFKPMNGSGIEASIAYRYEIGRFHQDVTFQCRPAVQPADFGMDDRARLEIITEVIEWPEPGVTTHLIRRETNAVTRSRMVEPDLVDETLSWGETAISLGYAFAGESSGNLARGPGIPVTKRLVTVGGRRVLAESIEWNDAKIELDRLPMRSASAGGPQMAPTAGRELPERRSAKATGSFEGRMAQVLASPKPEIKLAGLKPMDFAAAGNGFTVDYQQITGELNDYTFSGGSTYLVQSYVTSCNPTFEPGTVIKFERGATLYLTCTLNFQSGTCPIVFTAKDDNTIGDFIVTHGEPSGYYANYAMYCYYSYGIFADNIEVRHAANGLYCYNSDFDLQNSRFINCGLGAYADNACTMTLWSVFMSDVQNWWYASGWDGGSGWVVDNGVSSGCPPLEAFGQDLQACPGDPLSIDLTGGTLCDMLNFTVWDPPTHGFLSGTSDTTPYLTYTPSSCGPDSFTFTVNDGCSESQPATVTIAVGDPNPVGDCRDIMTGKNTPVTFILSGSSDACGDTLTFNTPAVTTQGGSLTSPVRVDANHEYVTYGPPSSTFEGIDGFTFTVSNCGFESPQERLVNIHVVPHPLLTAHCVPNRILLRWTVLPPVESLLTDFQIMRKPQGGDYGVIATVGSELRSYADTTVSPGVTYCYKLVVRRLDPCTPLYSDVESEEVCPSICSDPPCDQPTISGWLFTDEGFIAGGQEGAFRVYNDPSQVTASPWSFPTPSGTLKVRMDYEDDIICSNYNGNIQIATAEAVVTVASDCPARLTVNWTGMVEQQNSGYERMWLYVDGVQIDYAQSTQGQQSCAPMLSVAGSQQVVLQPGLHLLRFLTDTGSDGKYHFDAYYQFDITIQRQ